MIGLLLNGFFASTSIIAMDGVNTGVPGGWIDRNWKQLYKQFAYVCATCTYTFVVTALLAKTVDAVPGLKLRGSLDDERVGMDEVEVSCFFPPVLLFCSDVVELKIGEFASDYIEIRRDVTDGAGAFEYGNGFQAPLVAAGDRHGQPDHRLREMPTTNTQESQGGAPTEVSLQTISEKPENGNGVAAS